MARIYENLPLPVSRTILPNGLNVITGFYEFGHTSLPEPVSIVLALRCGSMHDGELPGLAHFVEHMLFEGPSRDGVHPKLAHLYEEGIDVDGSCSPGNTNYIITGKASELPKLLAGLADVVFGYSSDDSTVDLERGIILQELREDTAEERLELWTGRQMFPNNLGLHHDTAGLPEIVKAITNQDLSEFHDAYYDARNTALVVVGPVEHEHVLELATSQIPVAAQGSEFPTQVPLSPEQTQATYLSNEVPTCVRFYAPRPRGVQHHAQLKLAGDMLRHLPFGLIAKRLRIKERITYRVIIEHYLFPVSTTEIEIRVDPTHFGRVVDAVAEEINLLARGKISESSWKAIFNAHVIKMAGDLSEVSAQVYVEWLANEWLQYDLEDATLPNEILSCTLDDVAEAVASHLKPETLGTLFVQG